MLNLQVINLILEMFYWIVKRALQFVSKCIEKIVHNLQIWQHLVESRCTKFTSICKMNHSRTLQLLVWMNTYELYCTSRKVVKSGYIKTSSILCYVIRHFIEDAMTPRNGVFILKLLDFILIELFILFILKKCVCWFYWSSYFWSKMMFDDVVFYAPNSILSIGF